MTLARFLALGITLLAAWPTRLEAEERRVVEKKRVVVRVQADPSSQGYSYVYVDHEDGEPILLDSVLADRGYLGVTLLDLTPELRRHFGAPAAAGVMISRVEPKSPAFEAGVAAGDILTAIDGREVDSARAVYQRVSEGETGQTLELRILRDGGERTISATLTTRRRKQLDLGGLMTHPHHGNGHGRLELPIESVPRIELDPESMSRALSLMREHFDSPEWREQLERFHGDRQGLEERIRELEERLRQLERQLDELPE